VTRTPSESRRRSARIERLLASAESKCRRTRRQARPAPAAAPELPVRAAVPAAREVVVVGASTGGPPVVVDLLRGLGTAFAVPVVIVQHMHADHLAPFAALLTRQTGREVQVAVDGAPLEAGRTYLAGPTRHLVLRRLAGQLVLGLVDSPPEHGVLPAVDPLFLATAQACGRTALAVVCTGMGCDGAAGAVELRRRGATVLVQDRASSVVWGMPGATVAAGGADEEVPGDRLAARVLSLTTNPAARGGRP